MEFDCFILLLIFERSLFISFYTVGFFFEKLDYGAVQDRRERLKLQAVFCPVSFTSLETTIGIRWSIWPGDLFLDMFLLYTPKN